MQKIIICDIDGCLVNTSWIWKVVNLLGIEDDAKKWDFFGRNANALYNEVDKNLVKFLKYEKEAKNARIMFLTARNINIECQTIDFIEKSTGLEFERDFLISSRPIWDKSPTDESKRVRLGLINRFFKPIFAIDDKLVSVEMFCKYNIQTLLWSIGFEPKLTSGCNPSLISEYRSSIISAKRVPDIMFKAYSMDDLTQMFEDLIDEINNRKSFNDLGDGDAPAFNIGYKDSKDAAIFTGDILQTPDGTYGTAVWYDRSPAILSPGSGAIDFDDEKFFKSCRIVGNIRENPDFYENLVPEPEEV